MTNKLRRSMTSVLLAASLLFSSQSVVAFADYGSKSDASDLSPVQESVENATEEQQEDPSLSVEPVIGESTEAPVAAPMMARANAPVSYSAPRLDDYHTYFEENYSSNFASIAVYTRVPNSIEADGKEQENYFIQGSGWQVYKALPVEGWIFKNWSYSLTKNGGSNDLGNLKDLLDRYTFSDADSDWYAPYSDSSDNKDRISINAINRELKNGLTAFDTLHHSIYANYNPLVTVNVGENGTVTYNNTEVSHEDSGKKVEVEYGTAPDFTITPDTGYKVASVTFGDTTIQANEDGTYPLPSVTEPTTLKVEFEKAEENIDVEDLGLGVKFECTDNDSHNSENIMLKVADKNTYYTISPVDGTTATVTIDANKYLENYNTTNPNHRLVSPSEEYKIQLTLVNNTWTVDEGSTTIVTIPVTCKAEVKQIEHIEINLGDNLRKEIPFTPIYLHAEYDGDYIFLTGANKHFTTPPVSSIPDTLKADVDDPTKAQEFFSGFTCLGWNFAFDKHYISNAYISEARVEGTTLYMTLDIPAPEAPANINELLDVTLNCENPDHPEKYGKSKTYSDLLPNSYTIGEVKNNDGTYTCDITINPEEYLADYNNVTKTNHILVTTPENLTGIATVTLKYEDGAWKTAESPVTFTVTCKQSIPLTPSKPSDDDVKAIMDKISVTVDCTNTTGHDPMNHTLTGAEFTVGDIYSVAPFASKDPVILCPVTINNYVSLQNGFITQYNAATNESHTLSSGFIPASIVLTYNKDAQDGKGAWENHDLENITLSLTCNPTTPGGGGEGTNPGGNGGNNDDDDDRYTGGNTVTRTINDDDVPLNDRPNTTTTIDDEDVPLADLPDDTVTIDDGEVPLKANPSTGDSLPFAAMAAAALSLGGVIVLNRKKK